MVFTFSSGQRVLDGYTLKRGIGMGGFGEVYYAVSDGGKEVALKHVRGQHLDVELRGIAHCLNLKHPNLLALYDLRTDGEGSNWVVMEYISGECLTNVLNRYPAGVPQDLVREWFLALARAVGCLHDHGIVHRDLKPGNIFIENGTVKVGDYGLSKLISSSQRTAQTQSVGTVHYMAPEISTGNYNKQIDVYSAGVILYEMLTGKVPFDGESAGEILMKHLTSPPDLSKVPDLYVPIVAKALSKNPAHRYSSMAEMAHDVEQLGAPTRNGKPERNGVSAIHAVSLPELESAEKPAAAPIALRGQIGELCGSLALAVVWSGLFCLGLVALGLVPRARVTDVKSITGVGISFLLTVAASWAVLIPAKFWHKKVNDSASRRMVMLCLGLVLGCGALWLDGWAIVGKNSSGQLTMPILSNDEGLKAAAGYLSYFGLCFFAIRWWRLSERQRTQRFSLLPTLAVGFWSLVLLLLWPDPTMGGLQQSFGALSLILASAIVQLVSPWQPAAPRASRPVRMRYN